MFLRKIIPQDKVFFELFRELAVSVREAGEAHRPVQRVGREWRAVVDSLDTGQHLSQITQVEQVTHHQLRTGLLADLVAVWRRALLRVAV